MEEKNKSKITGSCGWLYVSKTKFPGAFTIGRKKKKGMSCHARRLGTKNGAKLAV